MRLCDVVVWCSRVWDSATGQCKKTLFSSKTPPVSYVKFTPNGKFVLASYLDHSLRLWNFQTSRCLKEYTGHQNEKYCCFSTFSLTHGDGKQSVVVSGSEDGCVFLWDLQTKAIIQKLPAHSDVVLAVSCHPHVSIIATGSMDHTITLWKDKSAAATSTAAASTAPNGTASGTANGSGAAAASAGAGAPPQPNPTTAPPTTSASPAPTTTAAAAAAGTAPVVKAEEKTSSNRMDTSS